MKDPFKIYKTCYTPLSVDEVNHTIRKKIEDATKGIFKQRYRGYYRSGAFLILCTKGRYNVKIMGNVTATKNGSKIELKCRMGCSPFYVLIPVLLFFMFALLSKYPFIINGEEGSFLQRLLFSVFSFLFLGAIISIPQWYFIQHECRILEKELRIL